VTHAADLSGIALYAGICALVFVESGVLVAFWLPGDTVLFAAGLAAARPGSHVAWWGLALLGTLAAAAGNALGYAVGARLGRPLLARRYGGRLARAEELMERYGAAAVVVARFVPWARTFVPHLAGATRLAPGRFAAATVLGAITGVFALVALGAAAAHVPGLRHAAAGLAITVAVLSVLGPVVAGLRRRRRRPQDRSGGATSGPHGQHLR
jgi:membrane-associated protein